MIGKPSPPVGPLDIKDIFADNMTLEWKPPEDDGGSPIEYYEVRERESLFRTYTHRNTTQGI